MRIIGGKYKGRTINALKAKGGKLRPTKAVTKEAVFNILSHGRFSSDGLSILQDARVLDLFCGAGAFSAESLSRGAKTAVLIDIEQEHLEIAKKNITDLGENHNAFFIRADSTNPPTAKIQCNLVFIDPPYKSNLINTTLINIAKQNWLDNDAIIVLETAKTEEPEIPSDFSILIDRHYGNSRIRILHWHGRK